MGSSCAHHVTSKRLDTTTLGKVETTTCTSCGDVIRSSLLVPIAGIDPTTRLAVIESRLVRIEESLARLHLLMGGMRP